MIHPHDAIRRFIEIKKNLFEIGHAAPLEILEQIQWNKMFWDACKNRMIQGSYRYGNQTIQREQFKRGPFKSTAERYVKQYLDTGNVENLFDLANRCMIEFGYEYFDKQNFTSQDDAEHEQIKD